MRAKDAEPYQFITEKECGGKCKRRLSKRKRRQVTLPPFFGWTAFGLLAQHFAEGTRTCSNSSVHNQTQITFSNARLTDRTIGDEREAVSILEPARSNDVALESRRTRDS